MTEFWDRQWNYVFIGILSLVLVVGAPLLITWPFFWAIGYFSKKLAPGFWSPLGD